MKFIDWNLKENIYCENAIVFLEYAKAKLKTNGTTGKRNDKLIFQSMFGLWPSLLRVLMSYLSKF